MASTKRSALATNAIVDLTALHEHNTKNFVEYASHEQRAPSHRSRAPSGKRQAKDSSFKQEASSDEQQASSAKPRAASSSI